MATLTLDEFLTKARPLNPDYTDNELIQAYQDRYTTPPTQTVSAAPLMTLDEFLPKARKLNPDYSDEELTSAWQEKYGDRGAREKDQGDTVRGFKESFQQVPQMAAGLAAGAGAVGEKVFGEGGLSTALKNTGIKHYREVEQDIARDSKPSDSLSEAYNMARAGNSGALVDWLQHGLGYVGGQGLQALATAGIGYAGGKLLLKPAAETLAQKLIAKESARIAGTEAGARLTAQELTKQATSNVAGKIGQVAALGSVATGMEGGEIHGDLVLQAEQEGRSLTGWELAKAFAASLGAGALEFVGDKIGVDLLLGKSIANRLAKTRLGNVAAGAAVGAVAESGTEALQTPIEQLGKGQDPTSPESVRETIDSAALGFLGGTSMGATGGAFTRPQGAPAPTVTERTSDEMGLGQPASAEQSPAPTSPLQIEGFPQAGEVRKGRVYGGGPVLDVSPLPDVSPVLQAGSLDDAIANAVGVVRGATETAKSRASEFARMTAKAKNETDALLANAPEKRPAFDVPTLPKPEAQPATLFNQPSPIVPGQAFTPRPEPIDDPRDRLAEERARMVAQREQQRMQQQANPVSETVAPVQAVAPADMPLPSQIDLAYPSSKQVRDLIHEKGLHLDTPVFREILKQTVKKEQFADLTPQELQRLADTVQKINAPQQPAKIQEAPPQGPLTPAKEKPYAPVTTIPEAQVPRSELTPEKNTEMLLRAEKAKADLEIAGTERGGRFQLEQTGTGSTNEVRGLKSATADWYKDLTSGPSPAIRGDRKQSAREKIEVAIQKIIKDQGADRGRAVEQVKAALLQDQEFHQTPWGKDLNSAIQGEWPGWIEKPQVSTQATENAQEFQKVPKSEDSNETVSTVPSKSGQIDSENARLVLSPVSREGDKRVQENPRTDARAEKEVERQKLRARLQRQGQDTQKAVPEVRSGEGGNAPPRLQQTDARGMDVQGMSSGTSQLTDLTDKFHNVPRFTSVQEPKKVPLSRKERLAQQKQKMEAKKPELLPSETPGMEPQLATASPEPSTQKAAPKTEEPFTLTGPDVSNPKVKESGPEQLSIDVPPPTSGERPIIGREATHEEAPLFSKAAQEKDVEQTTLSEPVENPDDTPVIPKQDSGSSARSPAEILAAALRTVADQIQGKPAESQDTLNTVEAYERFRGRLRDGEITLDEYKQAFKQLNDNKEVIVGGLKKLTKDQLIKQSNSWRSRKGDSKDELIRQVYDGMLGTFALGRGVSYVLSGKGGYEQALAKMVAETTEADLTKYAEDLAKSRAEYKQKLEGFANPQTLEDFDTRVRIKGEDSLTPEQLARYDELLSHAGREKRKQSQEQKSTVQGVNAGTDLQLIESKHTKTGERLWVVKLADRVDRAVYDRLNQAAYKLGGRYSSYNKDGAIPGFTFRSEEAAKSFIAAGKGESVSAAPVREEAKTIVQNNAVAKLREMADNLEAKADEVLNADRKTNTARRARMASSSENAAYGDKAQAETMRNLADAIESGESTHLSGLRTKTQVEMLDHMIESAKHERIRKDTKGSYVDYERQKDRKATPKDAADATFPTFNFYKDNLHSAMNALKAKPATERLRMRLTKLMAGVKDGGKVQVPREDAELALDKLSYEKHPGAPFWQWREASEKQKRLESMGITSLPELRAALREFVEYRGKRGTIDKAKQLERSLIGNKGIGNDFFPTPKATAQRMVDEAGIEPGMKVLEPSAGNGNIAEAIRAAGVNPDVVEQSSNLREILEAKGFNLAGQDFLEVKEGGYDRIIMNPPFSNGQDAEHIQHAYSLLKPGGKLVAIAGEGVFFRNDAKATAFRDWLEETGGTSEKLPEGTFNDASLMATTGVNARMVVVEKPESVTVQELSAKYGLTDQPDRADNQSYVLREGEQQQRNFEIAKQAIDALNEDSPIYDTSGNLSGDRIPSRTVALSISPQFIEQGTIDLTGQVVSSAEDLAKLAQVYRSPLFETLRIFYVKGGKIIGHEGITSRLPGLVKFGITQEEVMQRVGDWDRRKQALGATSYYLLHNHPSGNSAPSQADFALTGRIASLLPGFKGHVVIDSNEFTNIATDAQGNLYPSTRKMDFGKDRLLTPSMPHPLLNATVLNHTDMARVGKSMQAPKGFATILYRSGGKAGKTRAIQEVSAEFLTNPGQAKQYIQQQADAFGAVDALVHYSVQNNDQLADRLARSMDALIEQGIVVDYVTSGEMGRSMSRRELGVEPKTRSTSMGRAIEDIPTETTEEERAPYETGTINPTEARDRLVAVKTSMRPYLLGALGLEQLSQVYGKDHAEVHQYNKATQAMEADFTEMSRESDKVARAWTDLNIPVADKMAQAMEDARFLNFDPDPRKKQEADSQKKKELRTRFDQLPEEAKTVYRMARDFYTNMAEQRFQALKERIERAGGTPENTRKLVDRLQLAYEQVRSKVYFPFTRFGENIVVARQMKDGKEVDREVHAFESVFEAQKFATMMKLKGWQVKQTVAREYSVDKEGPASKIVRQMHDIIKELGQGQQGLPGVMDLEHQLLDSLNQSFLQALPDMSYAKHFIHAKDVKGASKDALRSFAHSALHGAHHISRIRHADKVTKALMDLDQNINETAEGDTTEARQVYNELVKRHNDIMNPNTHPFSAWLGQLGFTMSLGGVVATGITNATQVPLVTYPWLGARYGFGKASTALARAYKDFLDPRTLNKDSLFDATKSKLISESERKMLLELARRGHIDLTQTMDLAGLSSRDNLSRKARTLGTVGEKVTRMLGFTFHVPEVMNRQVTALSTFRLEKEKGSGFDEALERAQQAIVDTHFLYQSFNRPRYMQGNFLRVLTMFKQYSQNIAYTYGRAASIWLDKNNATKEERRVAKRQLASMLTLQFGAAGALGMPFFGTPVALIMHALGAMGEDDDDQDWEVAFRQWLDGQTTSLAEAFIDDKEQARAVGKEMAEVVSHGASRLTPWDMAARLGQNDLFFREPQREREGRSAVMDWMMALGGPVPSYGVNFLLGMGDVAKGINELNAGFFMRGVEELTPAVLRNGVRSLRYTLEGVRTRDEYKQLDLNTSEQLGQVFGFTPARVAEMYESTTAVKNKEHRILNQQKALKDRFARAVDDQDDQAKQNILDDIRGFNERNPIFAITSNTLNRSIKTRRQHEAGMERGMYLPPRRRALMDDGDFGDF